MKKILMGIVQILTVCLCHGYLCAQPGHSFALYGLESLTVPVTINKMTNLVFPVNIRKGVKVSREIAAQKVTGVENSLELKALRAHFAPTNLSVYGVDGRLYSFDLVYAADPPVLNFAVINQDVGNPGAFSSPSRIRLTGLPVDETTLVRDADSLVAMHGFLRHGTAHERMRLRLSGIYLRDSLLWLTGSIANYSQVPYRPDYLRLFIVDRKRGKRTAIQELTVEPVLERLPAVVRGRSPFSLALPMFTIGRKKKLVLEIAEASGGRGLRLAIRHRMLLRARVR